MFSMPQGNQESAFNFLNVAAPIWGVFYLATYFSVIKYKGRNLAFSLFALLGGIGILVLLFLHNKEQKEKDKLEPGLLEMLD